MKLIEDLGVILNGKKTKRRWGIYECPGCFKHFEVQTSNVKSGKSTSCRSCSAKECNKTHGLRNHPLYSVYYNMRARCYNPKNSHYEWYGKEGVTVCDEWMESFEAFYEWSILNGWNPDLRLDKDIICDREDISPKLYSPDTCMFISNSTNSKVTRKICESNTSGFRGVSIKKGYNSKKYVTQISINGKKVHIGYYETALDAAKAYDDYIVSNKLEHTQNFKGE